MSWLPHTGDLWYERYELTAELGRGGFGRVYRAWDRLLERDVAIKMLRRSDTFTAADHQRFRREANIAASLDHPNIVTIYDGGEHEGLLYLVMRFVAGRDLRYELGDGALGQRRTVSIVRQIGSALDYAHAKGLVHRDVKPGNVLCQAGTDTVFLADFGISRQVDQTTDNPVTQGLAPATLAYAAPEQMRTGARVDGRTDLYALGCVLFECLTGRKPFEGEVAAMITAHLHEAPPRVSDLRTDLSRTWDDVIAKAMAKDPKDRFQRCAQLTAAAEAVAPGSRTRRRSVVVAPSGRVAARVDRQAGRASPPGGHTRRLDHGAAPTQRAAPDATPTRRATQRATPDATQRAVPPQPDANATQRATPDATQRAVPPQPDIGEAPPDTTRHVTGPSLETRPVADPPTALATTRSGEDQMGTAPDATARDPAGGEASPAAVPDAATAVDERSGGMPTDRTPARQRTVLLAVLAVVVAGVLAWLAWPSGGADGQPDGASGAGEGGAALDAPQLELLDTVGAFTAEQCSTPTRNPFPGQQVAIACADDEQTPTRVVFRRFASTQQRDAAFDDIARRAGDGDCSTDRRARHGYEGADGTGLVVCAVDSANAGLSWTVPDAPIMGSARLDDPAAARDLYLWWSDFVRRSDT